MKAILKEAEEFPEVMDVRMCARYMRISADTLYKYVSDGFIPAFKMGNRWRFRKTMIDEWMDEQIKKNGKGKE
jgi:excisionase family DNA binding protein